MILSIVITINIFIYANFWNFLNLKWLDKIILFNTILMFSYFEIAVIKAIIEKFTNIEFLNHWDQAHASAYEKPKFFGEKT